MKTYLICPVRGHDPKETEGVVKRLEAKGFEVHWPPRDVNQKDDDSGGYRVLSEHKEAMIDCDCVHVIWDGKSEGCLFDLGMAFAMKKKIVVISLPPTTAGKSFQNMVRYWEKQSKKIKTETFDEAKIKVLERRRGVNR